MIDKESVFALASCNKRLSNIINKYIDNKYILNLDTIINSKNQINESHKTAKKVSILFDDLANDFEHYVVQNKDQIVDLIDTNVFKFVMSLIGMVCKSAGRKIIKAIPRIIYFKKIVNIMANFEHIEELYIGNTHDNDISKIINNQKNLKLLKICRFYPSTISLESNNLLKLEHVTVKSGKIFFAKNKFALFDGNTNLLSNVKTFKVGNTSDSLNYLANKMPKLEKLGVIFDANYGNPLNINNDLFFSGLNKVRHLLIKNNGEKELMDSINKYFTNLISFKITSYNPVDISQIIKTNRDIECLGICSNVENLDKIILMLPKLKTLKLYKVFVDDIWEIKDCHPFIENLFLYDIGNNNDMTKLFPNAKIIMKPKKY